MIAGAPIAGMSDRATICLGLLILLLVCSPLVVPMATRARRGAHRPSLRRPARPVVTTTDPLALLGFMDRAGAVVPAADTDADWLDHDAGRAVTRETPTGRFLAELARAEQTGSDTPNADQLEEWLHQNHP